MTDIYDHVVQLVAISARVTPEAISRDTSLVRDLSMSSLDVLRVLAALEHRYGVYLPDEELAAMSTIGAIEQRIRELLAEQKSAGVGR